MTDVERRDRSLLTQLGAWSLALGAGMFLLVSYALHGAMGFNLLQLPLEAAVDTQRWLPQGWAFFTKDPQEERLFVYRREASGQWSPAWMTPHALPANAFGMDRASRAQGVEIGQLFERVQKGEYAPCEGRLPACLSTMRSQLRLRNLMPQKTLCGPVALVKQKPLPWAWSAWENRSQMPAMAALLEVQC